MKFTITMDCNNAAFDGSPEDECARIIRDELLPRVHCSLAKMFLHDVNGNVVGYAAFTGRRTIADTRHHPRG